MSAIGFIGIAVMIFKWENKSSICLKKLMKEWKN